MHLVFAHLVKTRVDVVKVCDWKDFPKVTLQSLLSRGLGLIVASQKLGVAFRPGSALVAGGPAEEKGGIDGENEVT